MNKIALLRNQRRLNLPDILHFARLAIATGASGLTVHPRPDQRHITTGDVYQLARLFGDEFRNIEFNVEGYPSSEFLSMVESIQPTQVTLVPDHPQALTSDHGWEIDTNRASLISSIARLQAKEIRVALFVDADHSIVSQAKAVNADRIELYTGPYAVAYSAGNHEKELAKLARTANRAKQLGIEVNAGHDLNLDNLPALIATIPTLCEVSIGHALTSDALEFGWVSAIKQYLQRLSSSQPQSKEKSL